MNSPDRVEIVGSFLALHWSDGREIIIRASHLRTCSPSAEQSGEQDIFGHTTGGTSQKNFAGVELVHFDYVGNYALKLHFSDGHSSGIFSWEYLKSLDS